MIDCLFRAALSSLLGMSAIFTHVIQMSHIVADRVLTSIIFFMIWKNVTALHFQNSDCIVDTCFFMSSL